MDEMMKTNQPKLLVDNVWLSLSLTESGEAGKVIVRGEFARAGEATENKRIYPGPIWEREIVRLGEAMTDRRLFGELDHPTDGRTSLKRVSHVITKMEMKDGILVGEAEVLPTSEGQILAALLKSGCKVGVSSRGYGSTRPNDKGEDVVQEDYRLVTFDMVAEPADSNAYPSVVSESKEMLLSEEQMEVVRRDARLAAEVNLRDEFTRDLMQTATSMKAEVTESVKAQLMEDPEIGASKLVLEKIVSLVKDRVLPEGADSIIRSKDQEIGAIKRKLGEAELQNQELSRRIESLTAVAKEVGYKYFLEKAISGEPEAATIRKLIGDVKKFESSDELKARVDAIVEDRKKTRAEREKLERKQREEEARLEAIRKEEARRTAEIESEIESKINKLEDSLERSVEANKLLAIELYAERKLRHHPKASRIAEMIQSAKLETKEEVDDFIARFREPARDEESGEQVRTRVRQRTGGGFGSTPKEEETPYNPRRQKRDLDEATQLTGTKTSLDEYRALSGLDR